LFQFSGRFKAGSPLKAHFVSVKNLQVRRPLPPHCYLGGGCSHQIQVPSLVVASAAIETAAVVSL